jgi:hypothetical protein
VFECLSWRSAGLLDDPKKDTFLNSPAERQHSNTSKLRNLPRDYQLTNGFAVVVGEGVEIRAVGQIAGFEGEFVAAKFQTQGLLVYPLTKKVKYFKEKLASNLRFSSDHGLIAERVWCVPEQGKLIALIVTAYQTIRCFECKVVVGTWSNLTREYHWETAEWCVYGSGNAQIKGVRSHIGIRRCAIEHDASQGAGIKNTVWRITGIGKANRHVADCVHSGNAYRSNRNPVESGRHIHRNRLVVGLIYASIIEVVIGGLLCVRSWSKQTSGLQNGGVAYTNRCLSNKRKGAQKREQQG